MPAFIGRELVEELADSRPQCGNGAFGGLPQQRFELGEEQFDRVEVWRIGWQVEQFGTTLADDLAHTGDLVGWQVVHHDDVARRERRRQALLDPRLREGRRQQGRSRRSSGGR